MTFVKFVRLVDNVVQNFCLRGISFRHFLKSAVRFNPCGNFPDHVNRKSRRGVIQRIFVVVSSVAEHRRNCFQTFFDKRLPDDNDDDSGRSQIFLNAGINQRKFFEVNRAAQHIGRHIREQGNVAGLRNVMKFRAVNRVVVTDVKISRVRIYFQFVLTGNATKIFVLRRRGNFSDVKNFCFLVSVAGKNSAENVIARIFFRRKVHRNHRELHGRAALNEKDFVIVAESCQFQNVGLRLIVNLLVLFRSVTYFDYRHSGLRET